MPQLTAPLGRFQVPPFFELPWQDFQSLCREILSRETGIGACYEYGKNGQAQFGADLLAEYDDRGEVDVAQCKCWREVAAPLVRDAAAVFKANRKHWRNPKARRFILIVACDVADMRVQLAIRDAKQLLSKIGMRLHVWGGRQLEDKLRLHRDLTERYCGEVWADHICGKPAVAPIPASIVLGMTTMSAQLGDLSNELSATRTKELDRLTALSKQHRFQDAFDGIREIRNSRSWSALEASLQARILRFEATTVVNLKGDLKAAQELIDAAVKTYSATDVQVVTAYVIYRSGKRDDALRILTEPKSINAFNLRLGLTLETGNAEAVIAATEKLPEGWQPDADTHRYKALALLFERRVPEALAAIEAAMKTGSKQPPVREAYGQIRYFAAISPALTQAFRHLVWPTPIPWSFVKRGRAELDSLKRAAEVFASLAADSATNTEEHAKLLHWNLAALCCHVEEQTAAAEAARTCLAKAADDPTAIVWALERGYDFDHTKSIQALTERLSRGGTIEHGLALCALFVYSDELDRAEQLLDEHRALFAGLGGALWAAQKELIGKLRTTKGMDLTVAAKRAMAEEVSAEYEKLHEPRVLFELCEIRARLQEWQFVADHAERLVQGVATEGALRLALHGLFRAGRYAACLETLERNLSMVPDGSPSTDLVELRIECRRRLGHVSRAVEDARRAFEATRTFRQLLHLFQVQLGASDTPGATHTARLALTVTDTPKEFLIEAARVIRAFDRPLATELWRKGVQGGVTTPKYVQLAYETAIGLGLEREAAPLLQRMVTFAKEGKGGLIALDLVQVRHQIQTQRRATSDILQTYARGHTIAHLVAAATPISLGHLYYTFPQRNHEQDSAHTTFPCFLRSASRSVDESKKFKVPSGPLHADVSALLVGHQLGILNLVEKEFRPIAISQHVPETFIHEAAHASGLQISRSATAEKFIDLVDTKKAISSFRARARPRSPALEKCMGIEWSSRLSEAFENGGAIVDYLPLRTNDEDLRPIELAPDDSAKVLGTVDIARVLFLTGKLSETIFEEKIAGLSEKTAAKPDDQLRAFVGKPLHLAGNIWETLLDAGLMSELCDICVVSVEHDEVESARRLQSQATNVQDLVKTLQELSQRIKEGLADGRYFTVPNSSETLNPARGETLAEKSLKDLIEAPRGSNGWVWCDDRMISLHRLCADMPLVGIWEVLQALRERNALNDHEYFQKVGWLRRANVRYLPVQAAEIVYHLRTAAADESGIAETPQLATLRRYIASCLLDRERLQPPQAGPTNIRSLHDYTFLFELRQEVHAALRAVWEDKSSSEGVRGARADWLWNSLYFDISSFNQIASDTGSDPEVVKNTLMAVASLFVEAMMTKRESNQPDSPRQLYLKWVERQVVEPFLQANAATKTALARSIGEHVRSALKVRVVEKTKLQANVVRAFVREFVGDLPDKLVTDLGLSSGEWRQLGITFWGTTLSIGRHSIDAKEFWTAVEAALNGGTGEVCPRGLNRTLHVKKLTDTGQPFAVEMIDPHGGETLRLNDPTHSAYAPEESQRLAGIRGLASWFDCASSDRDREIARIVKLQPSADRGILLAEWRQSSLEMFYSDLLANIQGSTSFDLAQLCPERWNGMLRHLRLSPEAQAIDFDSLCQQWLADEGLTVALERASCLPIHLPAMMIDALRSTDDFTKEKIVQRLADRLLSPVQQIAFVRICGEVGSDLALGRAREVVKWLFSSESAAWFKGFSGLLQMVRCQLNIVGSPFQNTPIVSLFVNWYHASRIYAVLARANVDIGVLSSHFAATASAWSADIFARIPGYREDIAHPRHVGRANLVLSGFEAIKATLPSTARVALEAVPEFVGVLTDANPDRLMFALGFITDWGLFENKLRTYIGAPIAGPVNWPDDIPVVVSGASANIELGKKYLVAVRNGEQSKQAWAKLVALFADAPLPTEVRPLFREFASEIDFVTIARVPGESASLGIRFFCKHVIEIGDSKLSERLVEQLFALARHCAREEPNRVELGLSLLDSLVLLSVQPNDGKGSAKLFFDRAEELLKLWPNIAKPWVSAIGTWPLTVPVEQQGAMWRFVLHVRALG